MPRTIIQERDYSNVYIGQNRQGACYGGLDDASERLVNETQSPSWSPSIGSPSIDSIYRVESNQSNTMWNRRASSYAESSSVTNSLRTDRPTHVGAGPRSMQPGLTSPARSPRLPARHKGKMRRRSKSISEPIGPAPPARSSSHKVTEKKYREKLNDEFSTLCSALPPEYVSAAADSEGSLVVSKVDTLQLAIGHIEMLEKQQKELKQENLVLKGQLEWFESLIRPPIR